MKTNYLIKITVALLSIVLFFSCKKDSNEIDTVKSKLIGSWELQMSGGFGVETKSYTKGNGNRLIFTPDKLTIYRENILIGSTGYSIIKKHYCPTKIGLKFAVTHYCRLLQPKKSLFQIWG